MTSFAGPHLRGGHATLFLGRHLRPSATSFLGRPRSQKRPWERGYSNYVWSCFNVISCSFVFRYLSFLSSTGLLFIFSMVAMIFFYKYFAHDAQCRTNLYFVSFSLCQCVAATVISVLPKVQEAQSGTGKWRHKIVLTDSGNFGRKSNGKVRFGSFRQEYSDSHLAVVHFDRTDRNLPLPFQKTGSFLSSLPYFSSLV